jgi:hypothetical protein
MLVQLIFRVDNGAMPETYLAEYPDQRSPIAYRAALFRDGVPTIENRTYAETIELMLKETGIDDSEASLMASFYHNGVVMRNEAPYLNNALAGVPGEALGRAVRLKEFEGSVESLTTDIIAEAQDEFADKDLRLLTFDGLLAFDTDTDGSPFVELIGDMEYGGVDRKGSDPGKSEATLVTAEEVADALDCDEMVYQKELVWERHPFGELRPVLQSNMTHITLGYISIAAMGKKGNCTKTTDFIPVVTVLSPEHPARGLVARYAPEPS